MEDKVLLDVQGLKTYFHTFKGVVKAVDNVSFSLKEGEIFASGIARGRNRSLDKVRELLLQYLEEVNAAKDCSDYSLAVGFGYDAAEAEEFQAAAVEFLNGKGYPIIILPPAQNMWRKQATFQRPQSPVNTRAGFMDSRS